MLQTHKLWLTFGTALMTAFLLPLSSLTEEPVIYSIYRALDLGNPGEAPRKDYYLSAGKAHGIQKGAILEAFRRQPSYDLQNEKLHQDVTVPVALLKVIHVEQNVSIARLEKMHSPDKMASLTPATVMVGDLVRKSVP